jgi:hypothetical protein
MVDHNTVIPDEVGRADAAGDANIRASSGSVTTQAPPTVEGTMDVVLP